MSTTEQAIHSALRVPALRYGIPAGFCILGAFLLMMPGASPLITVAGWAVIYVCVVLPYMSQPWSSRVGAWTIFAASLLLVSGIALNCHYYIDVWGDGDPSRPVLMNYDAWSAWNNALVVNGRDDAMPCPWPAQGYGRFVGIIVAISGQDICIPLLFNALCILATIVLTAAIAQRCCSGGDNSRSIATCSIVIASTLCYFMVSGTILIKDAPLAASVALSAWAAMRLGDIERSRSLTPACAALIAAAFMTSFARPNYLIVLISIIIVAAPRRELRHGASCRALHAAAIAAACIALLWLLLQLFGHAESISSYTDIHTRNLISTDGHAEHHSAYNNLFSGYFNISPWQRLLLLPVTTAIQVMIPLPWTYDKYLMFGPTMAYAHMSFARYAVCGVLLYFAARQFGENRAPRAILKFGIVGVVFYIAAAYQFGGTISRYGIPLLPLLVPCAAYACVKYRHERAFGIWALAYTIIMTAALIICHHITNS